MDDFKVFRGFTQMDLTTFDYLLTIGLEQLTCHIYPRDAMRKRGLCYRNVTECLTVTRRYCV